MSPFAADTLSTTDDAPVDHQPAAGTGTQNDAEDDPRVWPLLRHAAHAGFRYREAVGVVGQGEGHADGGLQVMAQRFPVQHRRIRVLHQPRRWVDGTGGTDADPFGRQAGLLFHLVHQQRDPANDVFVAVLPLGRDAAAINYFPVRCEDYAFDFCAAQVYSPVHRLVFCWG